MKNKKSQMLEQVVRAAIVLALLFVMVALIYGIIVNKEIAFAGSKTEEITKDCDGDGLNGPLDDCPCVYAIKKLDKGQSCGAPDVSTLTANCPTLCKKR